MNSNTLAALRPDFELMIIEGFRLLLDRYEAAGDYPFVDMKFKVMTGEDFPVGEAGQRSIYDRDVIYGVIQGRAIEAVAGHIAWLPSAVSIDDAESRALQERGRRLLREVVDHLEALRQRNGAHIYYMFSAGGEPLHVSREGRVEWWDPPPGNTATDLFYAKGLMAAAHVLGDGALLSASDELFRSIVCDAIRSALVSDQQPMDPKNVVTPVPGRLTHGPKMLSLGGVATGIALGLDPAYRHLGDQLIRDVAAGHINRGQFPDLQEGDFVEFIDPDGLPWRDPEGLVWLDPGHAFEFIGLAAKVILAMRSAERDAALRFLPSLEKLAAAWFPRVFERAFGYGFNRARGGIYKAFDLVGRRPINDDMPWWNLPETVRTAALLMVLLPDCDHGPLEESALTCHRATMEHYAQPEMAYLPIQTRAADGRPVDVIPAMPDADPLYHTGLSLIDVLRLGEIEQRAV